MDEREAEARRLAERRARLRSAGDFADADALRERISRLGFAVEDRPDGFVLRRAPSPPPARLRPEDVASALRSPPDRDATVHWLDEGWSDDVRRGVESFEATSSGRDLHQVVVEAVPGETDWGPDVDVVRLQEGLGWAQSRNAGLERSRGRIVVVADGSVRATGDVLGPLDAALADPAVGVAGPVGAVTEDLREFVPAPGGDCDAIEGYLIAFRRELLERGVRFDPAFRFYRWADVDLSFQVKALGLRAVVVDVPIERFEHRTWRSTPPADRARRSKRNFYRFLDRWRGRLDLTVAGQSSSE